MSNIDKKQTEYSNKADTVIDQGADHHKERSGLAADCSGKIFKELTQVCPDKHSETSDIITVVVDEKHQLGKNFKLLSDGSIDKKSAVTVARGIACQYYVPDHNTLLKVLQIVSENAHAAIINAGWKHVPIGKEFVFLSKSALKNRDLGENVVTIDNGMTAFARLKIHATPSTWQLFDRDEDIHTPQWAKKQSFDVWRQNLDKILPGVANVKMLRVNSSSARVLRADDDSPVEAGNGHVWVKIKDASDADRTRTAIMARAFEMNLEWAKPRISKSTGRQYGNGFATIVDASVWTTGRLIFAGRPTCTTGLKITPQQFETINGEDDALNTSLAIINPLKTYRASVKEGTPLRLSCNGASYYAEMHNLSLDTEIELEDGSVKTVRDLLPSLAEKIRCQAPFRASNSMAAFITLNYNGEPFVFDSGTDIKHVLAKPRNTSKNYEILLCDFKTQLGRLIDISNVETVLNEEVLFAALESSCWLPDRRKIVFINRNNEQIELSEVDFNKFGFHNSFGHVYHIDFLEEIIFERVSDVPGVAEKTLRASLSTLKHGALINYLKLYKQANTLDVKVDIFSKRARLTVANSIAEINFPHNCFIPKVAIDQLTITQVIEDYLQHFPEFDDLMKLVLYARFATDRRQAFVWLHAPSSWGKGFMLAIFMELGLVVEVSAKEIDKALSGGPVGLSMPDILRAWILFVDEFKAASSELKQLNSSLTISPKNQLRCAAQLYTKIFASAENIRSLVGDGAEEQFNNRFTYLTPTTHNEKLENRQLFQSLGKSVYRDALVSYVAVYLNAGVERLRAVGAAKASNEADKFISIYQSSRQLNTTFGKLEDTVDEYVDEIRRILIRYAHDSLSGMLFNEFSDTYGLSKDLLDTLTRGAVLGYVNKGKNGKQRYMAIVLRCPHPVPFIKRYLDLNTDRSITGKLQYKAEKIADKLHMRNDSFLKKVRVYENALGSTNMQQIRGIVIFLPVTHKTASKKTTPNQRLPDKQPSRGHTQYTTMSSPN
jgi:hypothetical protein